MPVTNEPLKTLIVGAGLSGLVLADRLRTIGTDVGLIEKSRGVGGRMATRRSAAARFDHGAQFYTLQAALAANHQRWIDSNLASFWFTAKGKSHFKCSSGMTALAKELARDLDVEFEKRVLSVSKAGTRWQLNLDSGQNLEADRVIITAPLPQALEILRQSRIDFGPALETIRYAQAVVALVEPHGIGNALAGAEGYLEPPSSLIFCISDQKIKGVSAVPAFSVTLNPEASTSVYNLADDVIAESVVAELRRLDPSFSVQEIQIKKWRYSHPLNTFHGSYSSPAANLYLAGDAFGGPSLAGAARSANALADFLWREVAALKS